MFYDVTLTMMEIIGIPNMIFGKIRRLFMTPQERYEKKNIKRVVLKLNKSTDEDIILLLNGKDNVNGYLKNLIRKELDQKLDQSKCKE